MAIHYAGPAGWKNGREGFAGVFRAPFGRQLKVAISFKVGSISPSIGIFSGKKIEKKPKTSPNLDSEAWSAKRSRIVRENANKHVILLMPSKPRTRPDQQKSPK
ncbi:MAG TPA: hypothetical protein VFE96_07785, partial [Candidatus Bathyarchaeia archaeon]|nr:hypothetical protein [Candidatus Bathyarchaeia archaeon]